MHQTLILFLSILGTWSGTAGKPYHSLDRSYCEPRVSRRTRIVGGNFAEECEFPWVVSLSIAGMRCGGTILDRKHILTAAHCVKDEDNNPLDASHARARVGSSFLDKAKVITVSNIKTHPLHVPSINDYDLAILTLDSDLEFNECVAPICLPEPLDEDFDNHTCKALGWGSTKYGRLSRETVLRHVNLPLVDNDVCQRSYGPVYINNLKMCAGDTNHGGVDTCQGDSGGPLLCLKNGFYFQYGIASFGTGCALAKYPGVYIKLTNPEINSFIREAMKHF